MLLKRSVSKHVYVVGYIELEYNDEYYYATNTYNMVPDKVFFDKQQAHDYVFKHNHVLHINNHYCVGHLSAGVDYVKVQNKYNWFKEVQLGDFESDKNYYDPYDRFELKEPIDFKRLIKWCEENGKELEDYVDTIYCVRTAVLEG